MKALLWHQWRNKFHSYNSGPGWSSSTLAVRRAAEFDLEIGITKAIIEGDLETIVSELKDPNPFLLLHGHLIQDVKRLSHSFDFFSFTHVRPRGNNVTHALARWAIKKLNLTVWMEDASSDIRQIEQADSATFN